MSCILDVVIRTAKEEHGSTELRSCDSPDGPQEEFVVVRQLLTGIPGSTVPPPGRTTFLT